MESLLQQILQQMVNAEYEQRQTNQLLTELNNNFVMLIEAMAMENEGAEATPTVDMDGNPV